VSASNRLIVSILALAALAIAFWMLAFGPKRDEASKLSGELGQLRTALSEAQSKAAQAAAARRHFPADYRKLVVLGQAVPGGDDTASLMVELNTIGVKEHIRFNQFELESSGETVEAAPAAAPAPVAPPAGESASGVPASSTVPPTEAAASLLPLGASIGNAGLGVMPYHLTFTGNFFQITDFIRGIDSLVDTGSSSIGVDGRLITINGFALNLEEEEEEGKKVPSEELNATFAVNTYVTPPTQGLTAGATPTAPAPITTPAGASAAATQASSPAEPSATGSSESVAAR
jgi:Tfp pilus assembly protein PilO